MVSFLDGLQRVLLFTDNLDIADCVGQEVIKIEQSHMLFEMSFPQAIGISLVDGIPQVSAAVPYRLSVLVLLGRYRKVGTDS